MWVALEWLTLEWASGAGIAGLFSMQKEKLIKNNNHVILLLTFCPGSNSSSRRVFLMCVRWPGACSRGTIARLHQAGVTDDPRSNRRGSLYKRFLCIWVEVEVDKSLWQTVVSRTEDHSIPLRSPFLSAPSLPRSSPWTMPSQFD